MQVKLFGKQEMVFFQLVKLIYTQFLDHIRIFLFSIQLKLIFLNGVGHHGLRHQQNGARTTPVRAKLVLLIRIRR